MLIPSDSLPTSREPDGVILEGVLAIHDTATRSKIERVALRIARGRSPEGAMADVEAEDTLLRLVLLR